MVDHMVGHMVNHPVDHLVNHLADHLAGHLADNLVDHLDAYSLDHSQSYEDTTLNFTSIPLLLFLPDNNLSTFKFCVRIIIVLWYTKAIMTNLSIFKYE